ncbi:MULTISPECIES: WD40 repeat domain-containing protein [unclassified Helicobacter]|uniref:WD40 repeat domain-containing protein n=1 Tax=unclassified Helicobacter TaxID=2593540 RepID=UPI000CF101AB|nr:MULTISPECIES: WD40 repeat domain-containing protein [unclassified Helicobacter]
MFKNHKILKFLNPILGIGDNQDNLILVDNSYGVFFYSFESQKLIFGKRTLRDKQKHHIYSKAIFCSKDNRVLIPGVGSAECKLYAIEDERLVVKKSIKSHRADISCSTFSPDLKFFATGGEDGRVFVYTEDAKFYTMCPVQPDYISCIVFDNKSHFIAFGTFEHKLLLYDLKAFDFILELDTPSVVVDILFFDDDGKIFYICQEGESGILDLTSKQEKINKVYDAWLHRCILSNDGKYAYIVGRDDKLRIHNLEENKNFVEINLPEKGVSFIYSVKNHICICFVSGKVFFIDTLYKRDVFTQLLDTKSYEEARIFAQENNIFLKLDLNYKKLREENWKEVLEDVIKLFGSNQVDQALSIAEPYLEDPKINKEFKRYLTHKKVLCEFLDSIEAGLYQKAYQIADQQKGLKKTKAFEDLEKYFEKILAASKKMLESDYGHQIYRVKKLLEPFMQIPEKRDRIHILFHHFTQYSSLVNMLKNHQYKEAYEICQKNPFLKVTRAYAKVLNFYNEILQYLQNHILIAKGNEEIEEKMNILQEIDLFKEEADSLKVFYEMQDKMQKAFKDRLYKDCYKILEDFPLLISSETYLEIEEFFLKTFKKAMDLAQSGKTGEVYELLKEYFMLEKWKSRIDTTFQIAYYYEIKAIDSQKQNDLQVALKNYISYFGKSSELKELCIIEGIKETLEQLGEVKPRSIEYKKSIFER